MGYREEQSTRYIDKFRDVEIGKTRNRSVIGSMNDYVYHFKYLVEWHGGWEQSDLAEIVTLLNRTLQLPRDFHNSYEALKARLGTSGA